MRMISVDPGTVTIGVVIWDLNNDFTIDNFKSFTIYIDPNKDLNVRMQDIYHIFNDVFKEEEPFHLAHESGFINRFRPQAFGPIYTTIYLIRQAFINTIGVYGMYAYPPKMVKSIVSKGTADKDDMFTAVNSIKELKPFITGIETEHEIDAIAIGYSHLLNIRNYPEVLLF